MNSSETLVCSRCSGTHFMIRREASYLYTYNLDTYTEDESGQDEALPFLFDNREQISSNEYLECKSCGAQYPCDIGKGKIQFTILQKAIRSDYQTNPDFLG